MSLQALDENGGQSADNKEGHTLILPRGASPAAPRLGKRRVYGGEQIVRTRMAQNGSTRGDINMWTSRNGLFSTALPC